MNGDREWFSAVLMHSRKLAANSPIRSSFHLLNCRLRVFSHAWIASDVAEAGVEAADMLGARTVAAVPLEWLLKERIMECARGSRWSAEGTMDIDAE